MKDSREKREGSGQTDKPRAGGLERALLCCSWEGHPASVFSIQFPRPLRDKPMSKQAGEAKNRAVVPEGAGQWLPVTPSNASQVGPEHWFPASLPLPPALPAPSASTKACSHHQVRWALSTGSPLESAVSWVVVRRWVTLVGAGQAEALGGGRTSRSRTGQNWFPRPTTRAKLPAPGRGKEGLEKTPLSFSETGRGGGRVPPPPRVLRECFIYSAGGDTGLAPHLLPVPFPLV